MLEMAGLLNMIFSVWSALLGYWSCPLYSASDTSQLAFIENPVHSAVDTVWIVSTLRAARQKAILEQVLWGQPAWV